MQLADYLDFVSPDVTRLKGHRIGLEQIIERYHLGASPEQIALDFPGLSLEMIYGTIAYYLHNRAAVDAYLARLDALVARRIAAHDAQHPVPLLVELRQRLATRR
ncbi:MAG: DUF433 domain-containing protein [Chloroflexaceae bacterium]